jgi:hypothetical protein
MNRPAIMICIGILSVGTAAAQSNSDLQKRAETSASSQTATSTSLAMGLPIGAALTKTIDSRKAKVGDEVTARTFRSTKEDGKTVIPDDTLLKGHLTQASARSNGAAYSTVGIVFDKAVLKHGEEIPLNVTVKAIALPQIAVNGPPSPGTDTAPLGYGPPQGGADRQAGRDAAMPPSPPTVPDTVGNVDTNNASNPKSAQAPTGGLNDNGQLTPDSQGVFGLPGIGLALSTTGTQPAAVITSTGKEVHLSSGTQLMLVTQTMTSQTSKY